MDFMVRMHLKIKKQKTVFKLSLNHAIMLIMEQRLLEGKLQKFIIMHEKMMKKILTF